MKFQWLDTIADLMDSRFSIPGTNIRFGLDPILNLIPVAGNLFTFSVSAILVWQMYQHGVSRKVVYMMLGNIFLDSTLGNIPLLGHIFDVYFKANNRNVQLLKEHYQLGMHQGRGTWILVGVLVAILALVALISLLVWKLFSLIIP